MSKDTSPEAEAVRGHACLVYYYQGIHADCMGRVDAAQVIGGGRFDVVPLCAAHIAEVVEDPAILADIVIDCDHGCGRVPHRWRPSLECGPGWVCGECGEETAWTEPSMSRSQFGERYGLDMRAEADRIALGHEPPLGIRGLATRWAWHYLADEGWPDDAPSPLDAYELASLLGWVSRRMAAYVAGAASQGLTWTNDMADREDMVEWLHLDLPELSADLVRSLCGAAGWPEGKVSGPC